MTVDVVCRMEIEETATELSVVIEGRTYCFCSEGCKAEFERHRGDYLIVTEPDTAWRAGQDDGEDGNV